MNKSLLAAMPFLTLATIAAPATAKAATTARLISCDAGDCLIVRGHRGDPQAVVRINGRPVATTGGTAWRVSLPIATVRAWSPANARTVDVTIGEPDAMANRGTPDDGETVRLPVGMLSRPVELAYLVVRAQ